MNRLSVALFLCSAFFAIGCEDEFEKAQASHSIEAYEAYLKEHPDGNYVLQATLALEDLYLQAARDGGTLEGYDAYLQRFPKGQHKDKIMDERKDFMFSWAAEQDTPEAWQKFIDEYPSGQDKKLRDKAKTRKKMAENRDRVEVGPVEVEQVNLAENPDGPLDGWGFTADIINKGDKAIQYLNIEIQYLNDAGKVAHSESYPAVATRLPGNMPMEEGFSKPIAPGKARTFNFTTGDLPTGWSKKVKLVPIDIGFVGEQ